jgi:hypothetical protein
MSIIKKKVLRESEVDKLLHAIDHMNELSLQKGGWLYADAEPKSVVERYVKKVMTDLGHTDAAGYEWWIHDNSDGDGNNPHFDKDEELADNTDQTINPLYGTVTYLNGEGQPTTVCDIALKKDSKDGSDIEPQCNYFAWSYPTEGTIMRFDGNRVHGVPPGDHSKDRITFMINVWEKPLSKIFDNPYTDDVDIELEDNELERPTRVEDKVMYQIGAIQCMGEVVYQLLIPTLSKAPIDKDLFIARRIQDIYLARSEEEFKENINKMETT